MNAEQSVSQCFQDSEYFLVSSSNSETLDFNQALSSCDLETSGSTLASITNFEAVDFVNEFLSLNELSSEIVFFGLTRLPASDLTSVDLTDPSLFSFVD